MDEYGFYLGVNVSTFNRLQPPMANTPDVQPSFQPPTESAPHTGGVDPVAAMFPPQPAGSYLADILGVEVVGEKNYEGSLTDLTAPEVLCNKCAHGHILKSRAATQNRKADGTPFYFLFGQCLRVTPPMSLDDLRVEHCNQFQPAQKGESP